VSIDLPEELLERISNVTNKRARVVLDHIIEHGSITTEKLKELGYNHAPRAARDVREEGIVLDTNMIVVNGKRMAQYTFGDPNKVDGGKAGGRKIFPKKLKEELYENSAGKCYCCSTNYEIRYFSVDHRMPYKISGDDEDFGKDLKKYMNLCGSCQRSKSWSCEHCKNWLEDKDPTVCATCYWSNPEQYAHVAMQQMRRLELVWSGDEEVADFNIINSEANQQGIIIGDFVKQILKNRNTK